MPLLFALTLFTSASLLFMVQPMVGKMILPLLGGSPAAWNTCMVFFQALLLLGYLYAHRLTELFGHWPGKQSRLHLYVLGATVGWLVFSAVISPKYSPIAVFETLAPQGVRYPMFGVLVLLTVAIGLPFLVVSTSAPLLQKWFAYTKHPSSRDPYFLYAASNAGSLISLLGYPLVIEPSLTVAQQTWLWAGGFVLLVGMVKLCGEAAANPMPPEKGTAPPKKRNEPALPPTTGILQDLKQVFFGFLFRSSEPPAMTAPEPYTADPPLSRKLRWLGLAFVPSSLMLGVTFYMTTDIASVPLLWVIPLALYLITFIIAFGRTPDWFRPLLANAAPVLVLLLVFVLSSGVPLSTFQLLMLHIASYFFLSLLMHTELAHLRPDPRHLTGYFLTMSIGGVLGGIFNAIVAPILLPQASYEYGIAIVIGCMLIPVLDGRDEKAEPDNTTPPPVKYRWMKPALDGLIPLLMLGFAWGLTRLPGNYEAFGSGVNWIAGNISSVMQFCGLNVGLNPGTLVTLILYALPCMLCFLFIDRPIRFGLCVFAILLVLEYRKSRSEDIVESARSFFGILKVERDYPVFPGESGIEGIRLFLYPSVSDDEISANAAVGGGAFVPFLEESRRTFLHANLRFSFYKLLHGTTLHGMQGVEPNGLARQSFTDSQFLDLNGRQAAREWAAASLLRDHFRMFGAQNEWDSLLLSGMREGWDFRQEPLTYYHRTGPVGEIVGQFRRRHGNAPFAMVGLGTGSAAAYAMPGQKLTFYEIDPTVIRMVENPHVMNPKEVADGKPAIEGPFTYVRDARRRGAEVEFILGDARIKLEDGPDRKYALLLVDAFSSDSIPVHLLTLQAMQLYKERLTPGGILALHISNRYIKLEPVVAALAKKVGMVARVWGDGHESMYPGKTASSWVILAANESDLDNDILAPAFKDQLGALGGGYLNYLAETTFTFDHNWQPLHVLDGVPAWTDDYSDVLSVMQFNEVQKLRKFFGLPTPLLKEKK